MLIYELRENGSLPYALVKLKSDKYEHVWLPVNRDYSRPSHDQDWLDHQQHIDDALVFESDPREFEGVWSSVVGDTCYLYDRSSELAADYKERMEALLARPHFFHGRPYAPLTLPQASGHRPHRLRTDPEISLAQQLWGFPG